MLVMCLSRRVCTIRSHSNRSWPFENFLSLAPRVVVATRTRRAPNAYVLHCQHVRVTGQSESKVLGNSVRFLGHSVEGEGDPRLAMSAVAPSGTGEVQKGVGSGKVIQHT